MRYYIKAFKNYCNSDGRATRKELWLFFLFHYLVLFILSFLDGVFGFYSTSIPLDYGYMTLAYLLISICPAACVQVRRLHDVGKSGTWWLLFNVPLVCFYVLYLYLKRGTPGINQYGMPPVQQQYKDYSSTLQTYESLPEESPAHYRPIAPEITSSNGDGRYTFCEKCGAAIDPTTKKCSGCGTQYFRAKTTIPLILLSVLLIASIGLNAMQHLQGKAAVETVASQMTKIEELEKTVASQKNTISSQKSTIASLEEKSGYFDTICKELSSGNLGYAASNFMASESVIVVDKNETNRKFTLTANWTNGGTVSVDYSDNAAIVSFDNDSWTTSTKMSIEPWHEGVTAVTFSNNVDSKTFKILIIVTD